MANQPCKNSWRKGEFLTLYYSCYLVASISASDVSFTFPENIRSILIPVLLTGQKAPGRQCMVTVTTVDGTAISTGTVNVVGYQQVAI